MSLSINKKDRSKFQEHPRVKIYYLRNDQQNINENRKNSVQTAKPTVSCLSSFIQHDKNAFLLDSQISIKNAQNYPQQKQNELNLQHINNSTLQKVINKKSRKISHTEMNQKFNKNAFTTEINTTNNDKNSMKNLTVQLPTPYCHKRFIKTSQQENFPLKNQNNQALSKDFLCNIVKEWNQFIQRQDDNPRKSKTKKWKLSNHSHRKTYRPQEIQELRKNKTLMKEHFNLFLQNQKSKRQRKRQKSMTLLKAVFNRDQSHRSISNRHMQNQKSQRISGTRGFQNQNQQHEKIMSLNYEQRDMKDRRLSLNHKGGKNQYLRLMYGPQVKLIPKLFEQRSKIRNFDWTKLDKQVFDSRKKMRNF